MPYRRLTNVRVRSPCGCKKNLRRMVRGVEVLPCVRPERRHGRRNPVAPGRPAREHRPLALLSQRRSREHASDRCRADMDDTVGPHRFVPGKSVNEAVGRAVSGTSQSFTRYRAAPWRQAPDFPFRLERRFARLLPVSWWAALAWAAPLFPAKPEALPREAESGHHHRVDHVNDAV